MLLMRRNLRRRRRPTDEVASVCGIRLWRIHSGSRSWSLGHRALHPFGGQSRGAIAQELESLLPHHGAGRLSPQPDDDGPRRASSGFWAVESCMADRPPQQLCAPARSLVLNTSGVPTPRLPVGAYVDVWSAVCAAMVIVWHSSVANGVARG